MWSHFNAYPVQQLIAWAQPLEALVKAAHAQGAVIQWNHPGFPDSEWSKGQMGKRLEGTGLDAWEHVPESYDEWKKAGQLPVLTGSTDTHDGTFSDGERSIILAPSPAGADIAAAVRAGRVALVQLDSEKVVHGPDDMIALVWAALAEGRALKAAKADRLRQALREADLPALIEASVPRPIPFKEFAASAKP